MKSNHLNQIIVDQDDFVEILYSNQLNRSMSLVVDQTEWIEKFSHLCNFFDMPVAVDWETESKLAPDSYVESIKQDWNLPENYQHFDIETYVLDKCVNDQQKQRVIAELKEFKERDMLQVLRFLKYFVDTLEQHNMVWGVGRGSSVASYVLYLLGVHRVDSIKYDLPIEEFLK